MLQLIVWAALAPHLLAADAALPVGTQLTYRGQVAAASGDTSKGEKAFDLTLWITDQDETGRRVFWLVEETGNGEFPWPVRFGRSTLDANYRSATLGPALLFDRGDVRSIVPVQLPFFTSPQPLAAGAEFEQGKLEYQVGKSKTPADEPAWRVNVRDPFGPKREMLVEQDGPLVLSMDERLTMGRGDEYRLKLELVDQDTLTGKPWEALSGAIDALSGLADKLRVAPQSEEASWNEEQVALLEAELPKLEKAASGTALSNLTAAAGRDLKLHVGRGNAVADLQSQYIGKPVGDFSVRGLGTNSLSTADLKDHVTVLHFWDYRDEPLREPYGQVGYLDFLYHRRKDDGLQLYGVAVNRRLGDETTRRAAERSVRKLKAFMNLSYPVLLDSGELLKQFGDPRVVGANLPLFVVIGPDAKILHYHVGHYDVDQDSGLKELDAVVVEALKK